MRREIHLDWKAYFYRFLEVHGEPIVDGSMLLFRDGWTYEKSRYQGPEHPPPTDAPKLNALKQHYWKTLKKKLECEIGQKEKELDKYKKWDASRALPLQERITYKSRNDKDMITLVSETREMNLSPLLSKIKDLQYLLEECEENLTLLDSS